MILPDPIYLDVKILFPPVNHFKEGAPCQAPRFGSRGPTEPTACFYFLDLDAAMTSAVINLTASSFLILLVKHSECQVQ